MSKYTWFRDNLHLHSIWEAVVHQKNKFSGHIWAKSWTHLSVLFWYGDFWKECSDKRNMVFVWKYTWFKDNLNLYSIWESMVHQKNKFSGHILAKSWTHWSVLFWYGDLWKECSDEGNMVFMSKYTWYRDNLYLYSICQAMVHQKNEFWGHLWGNSDLADLEIFSLNFFFEKIFFTQNASIRKKTCFQNFDFWPYLPHLAFFP